VLSPSELYPLVRAWLQALELTPHRTALPALAHLLTALLVGQSLRPSALMRALVSPSVVPAAHRYARVRRAWSRPWLTPAWLTPRLVRAVLALVPPDGSGLTHLALDSVRCGPWEVFTLGLVWHGRALPVGWAVLPYPWPKGRFTPTVCALLRQVAAAWPPERAAHLVADRAFPSRELLQALVAVRWGWTLRLRAKHWVTLHGEPREVRALLAEADALGWTAWAAAYGTGKRTLPGTLVIGRGLAVVPRWQANPGSLRVRASRQAKRQRHLRSKHPQRGPDASAETDRWVVLFSSHADGLPAVRSYGRRWAIEGSYRDAQGGWDGRHGWDLEPTLGRLQDGAQVAAVVGLWALGSLLQCWLGAQLRQADTPTAVQALGREWSTSGRVSVWARGRFLLTEPSGRLRPWLLETLRTGAERVARAPWPARPAVTWLPPRPAAPQRRQKVA
jgi:hypothetical protein